MLTFFGCADGLDPPEATTVIRLEGADSFAMGDRSVAPCGRFRIDEAMDKIVMPPNEWIESERITHSVQVASFCIDAHEVTLEQYRHCHLRGDCPLPLFTNAGKETHDGSVARYWSDPDRYAKHPVVGVTWEGAQDYCAFRGGRLPTEIEWEYAASSRGKVIPIVLEDEVIASIDSSCEADERVGQIALGRCARSVHAVGSSILDKTADGVYDLFGNVAEWTADVADPLAYCAPSQPGALELNDLFIFTRTGGVIAQPQAPLLSSEGADCLEVVDGQYAGRCSDEFEACERWCSANATGGDSGECLIACVGKYDRCAQNCLADGVLTVCGRRMEPPGCHPTPWCAPAEGRKSQDQHVKSNASQVMGHIVRGGHFQTERACEARPTRRHLATNAELTLGFRCAYGTGRAPCL